MHRSKWHVYSITSSAMASRFGGTVMPSTLAVLRLMTILILVDWRASRPSVSGLYRCRPAGNVRKIPSAGPVAEKQAKREADEPRFQACARRQSKLTAASSTTGRWCGAPQDRARPNRAHKSGSDMQRHLSPNIARFWSSPNRRDDLRKKRQAIYGPLRRNLGIPSRGASDTRQVRRIS